MLYKLSIKVGCPHALFWDDDPDFFWSYVDAYTEKREQEAEEKAAMLDYQAWLTGSYFVRALSNFGIMVKNPEAYPSEPYSITRQNEEKEKNTPQVFTEEDEVEKQQRELMAALLSYNQFK